MENSESDDLRCSFCNKSKNTVWHLFGNHSGTDFICNECVALCMSVVEKGKSREPEKPE